MNVWYCGVLYGGRNGTPTSFRALVVTHPVTSPGVEHQYMRNGDASVVSSLFGAPGQVEVERGLAEFRGGRPVRIATPGQSIVALPVDGIDERRLAAFKAFAAPALPRLVISARRARALGLDVSEPVAIALNGSEDVETLEALVAAVKEPAALAAKA